MRKFIFLIVLTGLAWACDNTCSTGAVCGDHNIVGAGPIPTPTPLPNATPDPCRIEGIQIGWHSGAQLPFLALGATEQLDATPVNSSGEVPKGCNLTREPVWTVSTPTICQVIGGGYNPFLRGLKVGGCSLSASMGNISGAFSAEVK